MLLQRVNPETVVLKTGSGTVHISKDGQIKIGDRSIETPGEYDISGVGVHALPSYTFLFAEGIRVTVVRNQPVFDAETNSDIFILAGSDVKEQNAAIKEQDPRVVIVLDAALSAELAQLDGVTVSQEGTYRITAQSLPADERQFILLA